MSRSFIQPGDVMTFTAPVGGVAAGVAYLIGGLFVVARTTTTAGNSFDGDVRGVHELAKVTGEGTLPVGSAVFWDVANARVTVDSAAGLPIGTIATEALTADTTADVLLHGTSLCGRVLNVRKRFTIAQVNAGATIVPAVTGLKPRMIGCRAISVGGAASGVTTVDILATLSASGRKLVAYAQANLTQSTVLRDGATGGTVLADGASYTQNDASTAVTIGKTGADVATATHIDVNLDYALE